MKDKSPNIRTGVIDIGTLKVKFEICEFKNTLKSKTLKKEKYLTVLGRDLDKTDNMIVEEAIVKTITALKECKKLLAKYSVINFSVVATDALRKAKNGDVVKKRIEKETGFIPKILSRKEEGKIFFTALTKDFANETFCAVDVGGGSVQVIIGSKEEIFFNKSFKTGTYFLQESFSRSHHPTLKELAECKKYVETQMSELKKLNFRLDKIIYGSTNIIDFFEAMNLPVNRTSAFIDHPYYIGIPPLKKLYEKIIRKSYEDRMEMYPAEPYYMWAADKALINIFAVSKALKIKTIIPSNYNISTGLHYILALKNFKE